MKEYKDIDKQVFLIDELIDNKETIITYSNFKENEDVFRNVELKIETQEDYRGLFLNANLSFNYDCDCYRCMKELSKHFEREFVVKIVKNSELEAEEAKVYKSEEDLFVYPMINGSVNIRTIAYEQMVFALPLTIVCDEECESDFASSNAGVDLDSEQIERSDSNNPFAILKTLTFEDSDE